jgi:hypothetical protein
VLSNYFPVDLTRDEKLCGENSTGEFVFSALHVPATFLLPTSFSFDEHETQQVVLLVPGIDDIRFIVEAHACVLKTNFSRKKLNIVF